MVADPANPARPNARLVHPPRETSVILMKTATRIGWAVLIGAVVGLGPSAIARSDAEVFAKHAVVAQEAHAAEAGRDALRAGGNAVDAAIATAFALAVTLPEAGNLGGGGFLVAYLPDRKEVVAVDFREMAPRSATPTMYLGPDGKPRPRYRTGAWAAGVPGTVRGLALAHARWGKRPWAELVRPGGRAGARGIPDLGGPRRVAQSPARPRPERRAPGQATPKRGRAAATSAGWATIPRRSPRWASPTARPGRPATGSSRPTWPPRWSGSPRAARTSSTPAGPPS